VSTKGNKECFVIRIYFAYFVNELHEMKKIIVSTIILTGLLACSRDGKKPESNKGTDTNLKAEAMEMAVSFAMSKFAEPKRVVEKSGTITVSDSKLSLIAEPVSYIIEPSAVYTGLIDDDEYSDAIVSVASYKGQYLIPSEHLIITGTADKPILNRVIESDMRVLGIKDKIITVEIRTHKPGSPLYNCDACKEVIKYYFLQGELVRAE